jgi:glutamate dehydrogenase/leucine dehydrogenase
MVVAVSDSRGGMADPAGLDIEKLLLWKSAGNPVSEFAGGTAIAHEALIGYPCDIWVPAARPDVFTAANAGNVEARLILPGANIPATADAERIFHERDVLMIPDFIANAGGVICGAVEYGGGTATHAFATIEERVRDNTREVLKRWQRSGDLPSVVAIDMAGERVREAMTYRRSF